ncbi:MAG: hypothetical protein ACRD68_09300, partial [Pyrinomonadaceae bacterium]
MAQVVVRRQERLHAQPLRDLALGEKPRRRRGVERLQERGGDEEVGHRVEGRGRDALGLQRLRLLDVVADVSLHQAREAGAVDDDIPLPI